MIKGDKIKYSLLQKESPTINEIETEAIEISEKFASNESFAFVARGIFASTTYMHDDYLGNLTLALFRIAKDRDINIPKLYPQLQADFPKKILPVQQLNNVSEKLKSDGLKTGFFHGHFRIFTPAHWQSIAIAKEQCDILILGLDHEFRTGIMKDVFPYFDNSERLHWLYSSGFDGYSFIIDNEYPYSDNGYENLLRDLNPSIYFGQESTKLSERATKCGVEYIPIPTQKGWSSSDFLNSYRDAY